MEVKPNNRLEA